MNWNSIEIGTMQPALRTLFVVLRNRWQESDIESNERALLERYMTILYRSCYENFEDVLHIDRSFFARVLEWDMARHMNEAVDDFQIDVIYEMLMYHRLLLRTIYESRVVRPGG